MRKRDYTERESKKRCNATYINIYLCIIYIYEEKEGVKKKNKKNGEKIK